MSFYGNFPISTRKTMTTYVAVFLLSLFAKSTFCGILLSDFTQSIRSPTNVAKSEPLIDLSSFIEGSKQVSIYDDSGKLIGIEIQRVDEDDDSSEYAGPTTSQRFGPTSQKGNKMFDDDSAMCCKTREFHFLNETLRDMYGVMQTIAQTDQTGSHQYIRHGLCGSNVNCDGICRPHYTMIPLVIHPCKPGKEVTYSWFNIPTYCKCHKIPSSQPFWPAFQDFMANNSPFSRSKHSFRRPDNWQ